MSVEDDGYYPPQSSCPLGCEDNLAGGGIPMADWDSSRFRSVALIQEASRNQGQVELVEDAYTGQYIAVKAMPLSWTCMSHTEFLEANPLENELPWRDIQVTYYLSQVVGVRCVCDFIGLFKRLNEHTGEVDMCLALSYCSGGDLFCWLERRLPVHRGGRESAARPLMRHVARAVQDVHRQCIAHGDLSLENVLLETGDEVDPELVQVRIIDFGAATGVTAFGSRGKPSYQAPEGHTGFEYDAMRADSFALGVMLFTLLVGNYPWKSTKPHLCPLFRFVMEKGFDPYLQKRKVKTPSGEIVPLSVRLSPLSISLLTGLLSVSPEGRLSVDSALEHPWFHAGVERTLDHAQ